jgi:hypothetical protein
MLAAWEFAHMAPVGNEDITWDADVGGGHPA